jgi:translocation and assembly module TamB
MEPADAPVQDDPAASPRRWRFRVLWVCALLLLIAGSASWLGRERIVGNLIDTYLAQQGVAARYTVVEISPSRQVIADLVVGDPAAPDLTADRVVVEIGLGLLGPAVNRVVIDKARVFGTYYGGKLSFGALDPLVFAKSDEPARLPALNIALNDARARIDSDLGVLGAKLDGAGRLDDGFTGVLAMVSPGLGSPYCRAELASVFGNLTTDKGAVRLSGPLRLAGLRCAGAAMARADIGSVISFSQSLDEMQGRFRVAVLGLGAGGSATERLGGTARVSSSAKGVVVEHDLALSGLTLGETSIASASAKGSWRALNGAERSEWRGTLAARDIALGNLVTGALADARRGAAGTLAEPLLAQFGSSLAKALAGADFTSEAVVRAAGDDIRLVIPQATLRSGTGEAILALSQVNWSLGAGGVGARRGNFLTGGAGLPRLNGRIVQDDGGGFALRLAMADYQAGGSRLAIPRLTVESAPGGAYRFSGLLAASGAVPGGRITGLELPLEGRWGAATGLALGTRCAALRFTGLAAGGLELAARTLSLCPARGASAMLRFADSLEVAAETSRLDLVGTMGGTPARIAAARAVLRYPGALAIEGVDVQLGEGSAATRLALASVTGKLGGTSEGEFTGGAAGLADVPLDLDAMQGRWRFDDGVLAISEASFRLADRTTGQPRFEPLEGKGAILRLAGDDITASAALHHPASAQQVGTFSLAHDLAAAAGSADIRVEDLTFGPALDAENLTYLAKGVVASARGAVSGAGRIVWDGDRVTSTGRFRTDSLDFAAAFGPVKGLKGEIVFTDLLGLTTAPDQRLEVASINTGIEVLDGRIRFALTDGTLISLGDARWPFMGGELALRPVMLDFGRPSEKRYVFEITGLDAAVFIAEMELTNLGASGIFDGTVPIVFDASGNGRIENGLLQARAPGGNVAYVGDLTYEDMGAISNYAFRALRSLDYRAMNVVLDGSLTGEIISKFQFDGIRQGEGTSRNLITRRLAKMPIQFRVNVKAESFFELSTVVRSFFDVSYLGNPVDRGLIKLENGRFTPNTPPALRPADNSVQPPESEDRP